jgi:hypothetical protein
MEGFGRTQASTRVVRFRQAMRFPPVVRRLRGALDDGIDLVRLKLDVLPDGLYQPVPGLPGRRAKRAAGTESRWAAMKPVIERLGVRSATDVGANVGYFPIKLAELGIRAVAVESDPRNVRTAVTAVHRNGLDNVAVMELELRPDTVDLLPTVDCTLFLSLWHHLVREQGLDAATQLTEELWARTGKVMFFDSGEEEMPAWFGLPRMEPTAQAWLMDYLRKTCSGGRIERLGRHRAFDAAGLPVDRALLAVIQTANGPD